MGYFSTHYDKLRFPLNDTHPSGFRLAQLAAIHAVSSHFFSSKQPAIITMPTGSGKTTVLMALAFLLRAQRVLVLTPSRLVREQIAENFDALVDLKKIEALPLDLPSPNVFATDGMVTSVQAWEELRHYDLVVATVPSVSPKEGAIPAPPADLFDLVLVDEAHHSPAKTWSGLLDLLRSSKQVLCTATPFRRDEKEIKGKLVFTYDLRRAYADHVFGEITFQPVDIGDAPSIDVAIARATEAKFRTDRQGGLNHLVMIRTDAISRAKALKKIYDDNTGLRLAFVSGAQTLKHVRGVLNKLTDGGLDGIVCVNMFGEGFNLPSLKIAAIHSPHKSLAVTLQFIGRFARTGQGIGGATFLAEPSSSSEELSELYEAGAVWRDIVQNLAASRIAEEQHTREVIESFAAEPAPDMDDFSLYSVQPYFHVKIFSTPDGANVTANPVFPKKMQTIFKAISDPRGAAVYVTRETRRSEWSTDERFTNIAFDIFIFHYVEASRLLFICSSKRNTKFYNHLARSLSAGRPRPLSNSRINRVLNGLKAAEFFSVGMRKRNKLGQIESYRILAGPSAGKAVNANDARTFDRGHSFGRAIENGDEVTIGVSVGSKVWSNTYDRIPELLDWCDHLASKISSNILPQTGSGLDYLPIGDELNEVPEGVIAMAWTYETYGALPFVSYQDGHGDVVKTSLLDFDLNVVESTRGSVTFSIKNKEIEWRGTFAYGGTDFFTPASADEPELIVAVGDEELSIEDYLNDVLPTLYCSDLSAIEGQSYYAMPPALQPFDNGSFEAIDWGAAGVEITSEKVASAGKQSIFDWLWARLLASDARVVFCDDGSGEMADFLAIHETADGPLVKMYHCKASSEENPGNRSKDLEIVCAQAIKSCVWIRPEYFLEQLKHRVTLAGVPGYFKGNEATADAILTPQVQQQIQFETYLVQPGILREGRADRLSNLLAAARDFLKDSGVLNFRVFGS